MQVMSDATRARGDDEDGRLMTRWQRAVIALFREGDAALPEILAVYDERARLRDPLRTVLGRDALVAYNRRFLRKVRRVEVAFGDALEGEGLAFATWTMRVTPRLGPEVRVEGVTRLVIEAGKIVAQEDSFDVTRGLPWIGAALRALVRLAGA